MSTYRPAGVLPGCAGKRGLRPWFHAFCVRVRGGSELAVQSAHLLARSSQSHANCCPATAGDRPIVLAPLAKAASVRLIAQFLFDSTPCRPAAAAETLLCQPTPWNVLLPGRVSRTNYARTGGWVGGGSAPCVQVCVRAPHPAAHLTCISIPSVPPAASFLHPTHPAPPWCHQNHQLETSPRAGTHKAPAKLLSSHIPAPRKAPFLTHTRSPQSNSTTIPEPNLLGALYSTISQATDIR